MQNVILVIHLILALCLIAAVLLQRSEGGALGIGGGGGGMVSARSATTALTRLTWWLAAAFLATSITLTVLAGGDPSGQSVLDEVESEEGGVLLPDLPPAAEDTEGDAASGGSGAVQLPDLPESEPAPATPPIAE